MKKSKKRTKITPRNTKKTNAELRKKWAKLAIKVPRLAPGIRGRKIPHFVELGKAHLLNRPPHRSVRFYKIIILGLLKWTHAMNAY